MILVGSSIDALVATFRQTGIFIKKQIEKDNTYPSSQVLKIKIPWKDNYELYTNFWRI